MNYRSIFRVFKLERELSDDETAFLNSLRRMNDGERELLVEWLSPGKKVATKKSPGKSRRASSLQQQIRSTKRLEPTEAFRDPICSVCGGLEDFVDHYPPSPHYHPFASSSGAPPAAGKSSPNGEDGSSTPNTATGSDAAHDVTRAASGGE